MQLRWPTCNKNYQLLVAVAVIVVIVFVKIKPLTDILKPHTLLSSARPVQDVEGLSKKRYIFAAAPIFVTNLPLLPTVPEAQKQLFKDALTHSDQKMLSILLETFHKIMTNASLQYFIYMGSLLGSYRHHSMIPWDDDLDIIASEKDKAAIWQAFQPCPPGFILLKASKRFKFYHESGKPVGVHRFLAPFLDVSFYNETDTQIWDIHFPKQKPFLKSTIFPLRDRPFLGHLYPAPRDPLQVLQVNFKVDRCYTGYYSHTNDTAKKAKEILDIPCAALLDFVPFVTHTRGPGGAWCEEVLIFRGEVLSRFIRESTGIHVC